MSFNATGAPGAPDADACDLAAILALNAAHERETSPLDHAALTTLLTTARHVGLRDRGAAAFLIALDQDAEYASVNFQWFQARYPRFLYVDRIIVAASARGRGLARSLYEDLFEAARAIGHDAIGCEVNMAPPNPASDAFHAKLGFQEVGSAEIAGGAKTVRYLLKSV